MTDKPAKREKRIIDWDAYRQFVDEFKSESDRAAVILGAAKLDLLLYQLLQKYLFPCPTSRDDLFDGEGPLSTFSAKIALSYRLGLISAQFARALTLIRRIRNSFAHEVSGCSLQSGVHRDRVNELVAPLVHLHLYKNFRAHFFKDSDDPGTNFRTTLAFAAGRLEALLNDTVPIAASGAWDLITPGLEKEDNDGKKE